MEQLRERNIKFDIFQFKIYSAGDEHGCCGNMKIWPHLSVRCAQGSYISLEGEVSCSSLDNAVAMIAWHAIKKVFKDDNRISFPPCNIGECPFSVQTWTSRKENGSWVSEITLRGNDREVEACGTSHSCERAFMLAALNGGMLWLLGVQDDALVS